MCSSDLQEDLNNPVEQVSWDDVQVFLEKLNEFIPDIQAKLPTEAQWEYAARGGKSQSPYPWGGPYLRNRKGCLLANFKPGRGNYPEDGGFYTVRADAYWPNDFGLYNMAGNVAEWTKDKMSCANSSSKICTSVSGTSLYYDFGNNSSVPKYYGFDMLTGPFNDTNGSGVPGDRKSTRLNSSH